MVTQIILLTALREFNKTERLRTHRFLIVLSKKKDNMSAIYKKEKHVLSHDISSVTQRKNPLNSSHLGSWRKPNQKKKVFFCAKDQEGKSAWHLPVHSHVENFKSIAWVKENTPNQSVQDMTKVFTLKVRKKTCPAVVFHAVGDSLRRQSALKEMPDQECTNLPRHVFSQGGISLKIWWKDWKHKGERSHSFSPLLWAYMLISPKEDLSHQSYDNGHYLPISICEPVHQLLKRDFPCLLILLGNDDLLIFFLLKGLSTEVEKAAKSAACPQTVCWQFFNR